MRTKRLPRREQSMAQSDRRPYQKLVQAVFAKRRGDLSGQPKPPWIVRLLPEPYAKRAQHLSKLIAD
jgi:hypothetical protein